MFDPRAALEAQWGVRLQECPRPELGDVCAYLGRDSGFLNLRFDDLALLALGGHSCQVQVGRSGRLAHLARLLQGEAGSRICPELRFLWLHLESVVHWFERKPNLARRAFQRAWSGIDRIYEREPLAGDQEALTGYRQLAQLALIAGRLSSLEQTKWSGHRCRI